MAAGFRARLLCAVGALCLADVYAFVPAMGFKSVSALRSPTIARRGSNMWSMQADNLVGNRFEDDDKTSIVRPKTILFLSMTIILIDMLFLYGFPKPGCAVASNDSARRSS
jgi:hypothetical protein